MNETYIKLIKRGTSIIEDNFFWFKIVFLLKQQKVLSIHLGGRNMG